MASKETQELLIEAIDNYITQLKGTGECPDMETMRKIIGLDDIRKGLGIKEDED